MGFIGIIANQKNEEYITNMLSKYIPIDHIIFIHDKNISNIKNVRFETVLLDKNINNIELLKKIMKNTKYIILNSDLIMDLKVLENLDLTIITYGFNNKATFTVSSIEENEIIICLQRIIKNIYGKKYEPQEFEIKQQENNENITIIGTKIVCLLYEK